MGTCHLIWAWLTTDAVSHGMVEDDGDTAGAVSPGTAADGALTTGA